MAPFSQKLLPLVQANSFPLSPTAVKVFQRIKNDIANALIIAIDPATPLVETNASNSSIAVSLRQNGHLIAFLSRTLLRSEQQHSAVEKEAYTIVEALPKQASLHTSN